MTIKLRLIITLIASALLLPTGATSPALAMASGRAYVEPVLLVSPAQTLSVIVAADSSQAAADAVAHLDGQATTDLWLIDSVAATLPASQVAALAATPGIRSIVANKGVKTSNWDGWVTQYPIAVPWDGRPDVQPTNNRHVWKLVNPVAIDVGADMLHQTLQRPRPR